MPIYEYKCEKCGRVVETIRSVAERDASAFCSGRGQGAANAICAGPLSRVISATASTFPGAASWRK